MSEKKYKHFVRTDEQNRILYGYTDAFDSPREGDLLLSDQGSRHFQLIFADGSTRPLGAPLTDEWDVPLYKLVDGFAKLRTPEELVTDRQFNDAPNLRAAKLGAIGGACTQAIHGGIDVDGARYSLTEHDQFELMAQLSAVKEGAQAVPYHADGELCRMFTAEEFSIVAQAAMAHIFYHRTYCNHLNAWIRRVPADELEGLQYGANLPEDLAASMMALIEAMGSDGIELKRGEQKI